MINNDNILRDFKDIKLFAELYTKYADVLYPDYPNCLLPEAENLIKKIIELAENNERNILKELYNEAKILVDSDRNYITFWVAYKELIDEPYWHWDGNKLKEYPTPEQWKTITQIENQTGEIAPVLTRDDAKNFIEKHKKKLKNF